MAQYTILPTDVAYIEVEDDDGMKFRLQHTVATSTLYLRQALNASPAFGGDEDMDWLTIEEYVLPSLPGAEHRVGVRDGHWVIDQTFDPDLLGFDGDEDIDWAEIEAHQL